MWKMPGHFRTSPLVGAAPRERKFLLSFIGDMGTHRFPYYSRGIRQTLYTKGKVGSRIMLGNSAATSLGCKLGRTRRPEHGFEGRVVGHDPPPKKRKNTGHFAVPTSARTCCSTLSMAVTMARCCIVLRAPVAPSADQRGGEKAPCCSFSVLAWRHHWVHACRSSLGWRLQTRMPTAAQSWDPAGVIKAREDDPASLPSRVACTTQAVFAMLLCMLRVSDTSLPSKRLFDLQCTGIQLRSLGEGSALEGCINTGSDPAVRSTSCWVCDVVGRGVYASPGGFCESFRWLSWADGRRD